jgi:hypothetical protein
MRSFRNHIVMFLWLQALLFSAATLSFATRIPRYSFACQLDSVSFSLSSNSLQLFYPAMTSELAAQSALSPLWKLPSAGATVFRSELVRVIDSLHRLQLIVEPYHVAVLKRLVQLPTVQGSARSDTTLLATHYFLDALLATAFDLFRGYKVASHVGYDKISISYQRRDDSIIKAGVLSIQSKEQLHRWLFSLEPLQREYVLLKKALLENQPLVAAEIRSSKGDTLYKIRHSLHLYRWLFHFKLDRFFLVNIAAAGAQYVEKGQLLIAMRAIVGKKATPTPRFASYCRQLILYPYWYVPSSIAIGEYLSKIKRDPRWLDQRNMQVIDAKGSVVDHHRLNWHQFNAAYFPYTIRQSTGCDNALGVLKFDIETPYGVYLHDTNHKSAFLQSSRFLSHGCIRLEEPLLLGNMLLNGGLDTTYLQSCFVDRRPIVRALPEPLAVFCLYLPAEVDRQGHIRLYRDVYGWLKK